MYIDFCALNANTKLYVFPLPSIANMLDKLGKVEYFSSMDDVSWQDSSGNVTTGTIPTWPSASQGHLNMLEAYPNSPQDQYIYM